MNKTKSVLTDAQKSVLEKGLNFAQAPAHVPKMEIVAAVEPALRDMQNKVAAEVCRAKVSGILRRSTPPESNISMEEKEALQELKNNEDIVIVPADKGNATVVLDAVDYEQKAMDVIGKKPFERVDNDPTRKVEDGINDLTYALLKAGKIKKPFYSYLRASSCPLPRFYGRAKVHKDNCPVRPVISAVGTATYNVSSYIAKILAPLIGNTENTVKNSKEFVELVSDLEIQDDEVMISYDVEALYTSLPINSVLEIARKKLEEDATLDKRTSLKVDDIIKLLEYCLTSTYFTFRDGFYHLKDGVAMGSPVSSIVANLFMEAFEQSALKSAQEKGIAPRFWRRYVDDVYSLIKKVHADQFLSHLNDQYKDVIRFTCEEEKEGRLPFLDVQVQRKEKKLKTSVFRKKTHTNRVLAFDSHHSDNAKRAVVISMFDRVNTHFNSRDKRGQKKERHFLHALFQRNGYPRSFVQKTLRRCEENRKKRQEGSIVEKKKDNGTIVLPYLKGVTEQIKRVIDPLGFRVVSRADKWQWRICKGIKDSIPIENRTGAIYEIHCSDCPAKYIGETLRSMKVRLNEHKKHIEKGRFDQSAVAEHALFNMHAIDWEKSKMLAKEQRWSARRVKEAILINSQKPEMNKDVGIKLSASWLSLFNK